MIGRPTRKATRRPAAWPARTILAATLAVLLTACTLNSSGPTAKKGGLAESVDLKGASFTVSGKEFTEQKILCSMTIQALQSVGAKATDKCGLNGSDTVRNALESGDVDMYWEYTGTAWIGYLKHTDPIADPTKQYTAVASEDLARNKIKWLNPAPFNNTYALIANSSVAKKNSVVSLSDYAKLAGSDPASAKTCIAAEFASRNDGWPGLQKAYDFSLPSKNVAEIDEGAIYNAVAKGKDCNFGEAATTDGRIPALHLTVLKDDKSFFPTYNPALTVRQPVFQKNPDLAKVINPIAKKLDVTTMQELNAKVDVKGQRPEAVAKQWLQEQGFIGK